MTIDWHSDTLTRSTPVDAGHRTTQNVRCFTTLACGDGFAFDRPFMAWVRDGEQKTMGVVADEWLRRQAQRAWLACANAKGAAVRSALCYLPARAATQT